MNGPPFAVRLVVQALRAEAERLHLYYGMEDDAVKGWILSEVHNTVAGIADRLEQAGSTLSPPAPASDPTAPAISTPGHDPAPVDPEQRLGLVGAMLLDFWSQLESSPYNLPIAMRQLLWDAIEAAGDSPPGERPNRRR